jgi:hypothetical protein
MAFFKDFVLVASAAAILVTQGTTVMAEAPETSSTEMGILHFMFRDSARGTVVKPAAILIDEKMTFNNIDDAGRVSIPVTPGDHQVLVKAEGYNDLDSRQTAAADHAPMNLLMLDPSDQPEQLKPENLGKDMPADGTVIVGFVTDDVQGKPVEGADVELLHKNVVVKSDADGFFKLPIHMPDGKQMPEDTRGVIYAQRDFKVSKAGYGFEERLNSLVESGSPKVYQIQLVRAGGGSSIDESDGRNNLQSSLFGLTNVEPGDIATTPTAPEDRASTHTHVHPN